MFYRREWGKTNYTRRIIILKLQEVYTKHQFFNVYEKLIVDVWKKFSNNYYSCHPRQLWDCNRLKEKSDKKAKLKLRSSSEQKLLYRIQSKRMYGIAHFTIT